MAVIYNHPGPSVVGGSGFFDLILTDSYSAGYDPQNPLTQFDYHFQSGEFDDDIITAGDNGSYINVSPGTDSIIGGDGFDTFQFDMTGLSVVEFSFQFYQSNGSEPSTKSVEIVSSISDLASGTYSYRMEVGADVGSSYFVNYSGVISGIEALAGGNSNDKMFGSAGGIVYAGDLVFGDMPVETFNPGGGNDKINGRGGFDILSYEFSSFARRQDGQGIIVDFALGRVEDGLGGTDRFTNIEEVYGSENADIFNGDNGNQIIWGGGGADSYFGGGGFRLDRVLLGFARN